ncbi:MAG: FAD binding domain-containing protein [Bosea sp. (in: a-proteobacteria)]
MTQLDVQSNRSAAIIGGSIGGLFAALLLLRAGWDVNIYERNLRELAGRGAGIVTHPALNVALDAAGIAPSEELGIAIAGRRTFARDGTMVGELAFAQVNTSWDRLFQLLRAALPDGRYHLDKSLSGITQHAAGATARFADGSVASADLVIGADGFRSSVRATFLPDVTPAYAGYVAWRGLVDESAMSPGAQADLFSSFSFCLPPGEQMLGYPVAGPDHDLRPGHRRFNFVWYRPAAEGSELRRLLTDDSGTCHDVSIPPPLIAKAVIAEMRTASQASLAPCFAEAVALTTAPFFQPIYDLTVPRMSQGRVAILGDAAFVARPHVGAGVTKAAEDAMALVSALSEHADIDTALASFDTTRTAIGHRIITRARHLGAYMQAQVLTMAEQEAAEKHRSAAAVMRETASLAFLDA